MYVSINLNEEVEMSSFKSIEHVFVVLKIFMQFLINLKNRELVVLMI